MIAVAKTIPNPREIAIGIRYWAWREVSKMIGVRPPKVVNVVRAIGRNRRTPASRIAARAVPSPRDRFAKLTMIRESLTTTPERAITPMTLISERS
jgi:hypothetical protein